MGILECARTHDAVRAFPPGEPSAFAACHFSIATIDWRCDSAALAARHEAAPAIDARRLLEEHTCGRHSEA